MIAGIDYSTHAVDVVLLDEDADAATWHRFELDGADAFDRARSVAYAMPHGSFWDDVLACGIEDPRGYGAGSLYRVQGAVLAKLPGRLLVQPLIPSSWRRIIGIGGRASKQDVSLWGARQGFMPDPPQQDAYDAFAIAWATRTLIHTSEVAA